jgi:hypothetical protein
MSHRAADSTATEEVTAPRQRALMLSHASLVLACGAELFVASMGAGFL